MFLFIIAIIFLILLFTINNNEHYDNVLYNEVYNYPNVYSFPWLFSPWWLSTRHTRNSSYDIRGDPVF